MQAYIGEVNTKETPLANTSTVICFAGCDFNCGFCNSSSFHDPKSDFLIDLREIKSQIEENDADVYFTGGEPCLQRQALLDLARFSRKCGKKIGMDFNGSKPECLVSMLTEGLIDFVRMDLHAPFQEKIFEKATRSKTFFIQTPEIMENVKNSLEVLRTHQDEVRIEFVTHIVPGILFRIEDLLDIAKEIRFIKSEWVLKPFEPGENLLDGSLRRIEPPSEKFLVNLKKAILKKHHNLRIRIEGFN